MTTDRLRGVWQTMLDRCRNEKKHGWADWGGKGIRVCARWHVYNNFAEDIKRTPAGKKIGIKEGAAELNAETLVWVPRVNLKLRHDRNPGYKSWMALRKKARFASADRYAAYDPAWESFEGFLADMGKRPAGTQLARRDETKPFCKENCYWKKT